MRNLRQVERDIMEFRVQGANQIALYGLSFLKELALKHGFGNEFRVASHRLEQARPTAVVLHNCVEAIRTKPSVSTIDSLVSTISTVGKREAIHSDKIIKRGFKIMTYCHSGEAMSFIKLAEVSYKKKISVIACKTEPLQQGITTAKELAGEKIPVTLIDDNAVGFFIRDVDMVIVGADAMRREGLVNKIGTSLLAQAAANASIPFYVVASTLKIDRRRNFKIEERPAVEITKTIHKRGGLHGIKIRNPAFDITPWKFVTKIVNENGIFTRERFVRDL